MAVHNMLVEIEKLTAGEMHRDEFLLETARIINKHYPHYSWVGYYFLKGGKLYVGPYVGKPTPHVVIDLDRGICGAAISQGETVVVDDINADPRYLACSLETKSEIVVPIRVGGEIIGELDIDSNRSAAFGDEEKTMLEKVADLIGRVLSRSENLSGGD